MEGKYSVLAKYRICNFHFLMSWINPFVASSHGCELWSLSLNIPFLAISTTFPCEFNSLQIQRPPQMKGVLGICNPWIWTTEDVRRHVAAINKWWLGGVTARTLDLRSRGRAVFSLLKQ